MPLFFPLYPFFHSHQDIGDVFSRYRRSRQIHLKCALFRRIQLFKHRLSSESTLLKGWCPLLRERQEREDKPQVTCVTSPLPLSFQLLKCLMVFKIYCLGGCLILPGIYGLHIFEFIGTIHPTAGVHFHDELVFINDPGNDSYV